MTRGRARALVAAIGLSVSVACGTGVDLGGGGLGVTDAAITGACASPTTTAPCYACSPKDKTCQANGCYGGYSCDVVERDCKAPGTPCTTAGNVDAATE
jgi:hypothetical protein